MEINARTIQGAREMITEDELEVIIDRILTDEEMAEKVRKTHE